MCTPFVALISNFFRIESDFLFGAGGDFDGLQGIIDSMVWANGLSLTPVLMTVC